MKLKTIINNLNYNLKVYGPPKLIDYNNLSNNFIVNNNKNDIIKNAIGYFYNDPVKWELPAKNYFVRICLACYLSNDLTMYDLLNCNEILPYDDKYSKTYQEDKEIYNAILNKVDNIKTTPGYKKTTDIFKYLYQDPLLDYKITVGYNLLSQDFFDVISFYKKYIEEYYFSFRHTMPRTPLKLENVLNQLKESNQYNISSNLLLNTEAEEIEWDYLIEKGYKCTKLKAVSVLTLEAAEKIKNKYPDLKIHISTHGAQNINVNNISNDLIYCINLNEPDFFTTQQQNIINKCKDTGIKIKYIANRGCVFGKHDFLSKIVGKEIMCCNKYYCDKIIKENPWINLIRTNIYKEQLKFLDFDFIKLSTREKTNEEIKTMLEYWTNPNIFTSHIANILIPPNKYKFFLEWCKQRFDFDKNIDYNIHKKYYNLFME